MERSSNQEQRKKKVSDVKTFPVPFDLTEIKENITFITKTPSKFSEEELINKAIKFQSQGNISQAAKCYQYILEYMF